MESWTEAEWNELFAEVKRRATIDPEFRALALKDAMAALKTVANRPIPRDVRVNFVNNSAAIKTIVLPPPLSEVDELSELDLEQVAGGDIVPAITHHPKPPHP